jgi:hypothetical protein
MFISPKYQLQLMQQVHDAIWKEYESYKNVRFYISKWANEKYDHLSNYYSDFDILENEKKQIDLLSTLNEVPQNTLIKMAIELGIETPDFIPAIPTFKNKVKEDYPNARAAFEKAFKEIEEHPDVAIGMANSALESIIKQILRDDKLKSSHSLTGKETLQELTKLILKEFTLFPSKEMPTELKTIGSSMMGINQQIEKLRSESTTFHGTAHDDIVIEDPMYAYFIVNSVATVGLLLDSFYNRKYKPENQEIDDDDLPF